MKNLCATIQLKSLNILYGPETPKFHLFSGQGFRQGNAQSRHVSLNACPVSEMDRLINPILNIDRETSFCYANESKSIPASPSQGSGSKKSGSESFVSPIPELRVTCRAGTWGRASSSQADHGRHTYNRVPKMLGRVLKK